MEPKQIESLLMMFTVIFVTVIVMLTVNEFGANAMTLVLSAILLSGLLEKNYVVLAGNRVAEKDFDPAVGIGGAGGLIGMSLFDLDAYYNQTDNKVQFPGWNKDSEVTEHITDILVRVVTTIVLLAYFMKSGIFKLENFNPLKRVMM